MKNYYPYKISAPVEINGEVHEIENGKIILDHIPLVDSIRIAGFAQVNSFINIPADKFFCYYAEDTFYRDANCLVLFNVSNNGRSVSVNYKAVGTVVTSDDMNEIKQHLETAHKFLLTTVPSAEEGAMWIVP